VKNRSALARGFGGYASEGYFAARGEEEDIAHREINISKRMLARYSTISKKKRLSAKESRF
jgi:hypothetical protein